MTKKSTIIKFINHSLNHIINTTSQ